MNTSGFFLLAIVTVLFISADGDDSKMKTEILSDKQENNFPGMIDDHLSENFKAAKEMRPTNNEDKKSSQHTQNNYDQSENFMDEFDDISNYDGQLDYETLKQILVKKRNHAKKTLGFDNLEAVAPNDAETDNLFEPELFNDLANSFEEPVDDYSPFLHSQLPHHFYPELANSLPPRRRLQAVTGTEDDEDDAGSEEEKQPNLDDMVARGLDLEGLYRRMMVSP